MERQVENRLPWLYNTDNLICLHFNFIPGRQKCVETHNQIRVPFKQVRYSADDSWSINALRFEFLHDIQEIIVDLRLVTKLELDLVQVREGIFHFQPLELLVLLALHLSHMALLLGMGSRRMDSWGMRCLGLDSSRVVRCRRSGMHGTTMSTSRLIHWIALHWKWHSSRHITS